MIFWAEPVFEEVGADAEVVEPDSDLDAFVVHGKVGITSAGTNDDTGRGFGWAGGRIKSQRRFVFVRSALRARCAIGPEKDSFPRNLGGEQSS